MHLNRNFGVLLVIGALGCATAYYFPDGPPHRPARQALQNSDNETFHPEPKQLIPEKPTELPQLPPNDGSLPKTALIYGNVKFITVGTQTNPPEQPEPEPRTQLDTDDDEEGYPKPEPRQVDKLQVVPNRKSLSLQGKQASGCRTNYAFTASGQSIQMSSANYPRDYPNNLQTSICLTSPAGTKMSMSCDDFNLEYSRTCAYDYLGVGLSGSPSSVQKYCGRGTFRTQSSSGNSLAIVFKSDSSNPGALGRTSYRFRCSVVVTGSSQTSTTAAPPPSGGSPPGNGTACQCGRKNDASRIVGGTTAKPNSLPWRCYLQTNRYSFFCGCSIISNRWILTAAHCTAAVMPLPSGDTLYVVVGDHDRSTTSEAASQQIAVSTVHDHPNYDDQTMDNDVSLLQLSRDIVYSNTISPVCLPFNYVSDTFSGTSITASGWGTTSQGGSVSNTLREVDLPVLTTEQCSQYYPGQITENMICTYNPGKDTCQGDSGGSIDLQRDGKYYAIGVVSWGIGCAQQNKPGVYAKTTKYLDFIRSTTGEDFCQA